MAQQAVEEEEEEEGVGHITCGSVHVQDYSAVVNQMWCFEPDWRFKVRGGKMVPYWCGQTSTLNRTESRFCLSES
jgi:hypothetical protein